MNQVTIKYGSRSTLARWYQNYWTEQDRKMVPWLMVFILGFFLFFGPSFLLWLASFLPLNQLGQSGASLRSHAIMVLIAIIFTAIALAFLLHHVLKPNFIEFSALGIRRIWKFGLFDHKENIFLWEDIAAILLTKSKKRGASTSQDLTLNTTNGSRQMKLALADLAGDAERDELSKAITAHAIKAAIEPSVFDALMPIRDLSFTEIWLNALSAPPHRERLLPLLNGSLLDNRYRIKRKVGAGGQGTVYLADDVGEAGSEREVILKETTLPVFTDLINRKQAIAEFHKEAQALEAVKHPNIVKFISSFVADHRAYLVLEYVEGQTLKSMIEAGGPLSKEVTIKFAKQMCDILSVLHQLTPPLIHRDFTPDNLIVNTRGELILLDFAIAITADRASSEIAGKAAYMAPEQFKGKPTVQSDVYSAGGTIYFCLTGQDPDPLSESHILLLNNSVSKSLNDLIAHATRYDVEQRLSDMKEFKLQLERIT